MLGIVCFCLDTGVYSNTQTYGGDAYTGIQHAATYTAWNVKDLARIVKIGFGSVLLIAGLTLGAFVILPDRELKIERKPKPALVQAAYPPYGAPGVWQNPQPPVQPAGAWQTPPQPPVQPVPQPEEPAVTAEAPAQTGE